MLQVIQTPGQQTYLSKLLRYDYTIKYKFDSSNTVTNTLSRILAAKDTQLLSLSPPNFTFLEQLRKSLLDDPKYMELLQQIHQNLASQLEFTTYNNLIFHQGKIWLPLNNPLPSIPQYMQGMPSIEVVDTLIATRVTIHTTLKCQFLKAQMAMKIVSDTHCWDVQFIEGDWVCVKLHPYRQTSLAEYTKLSKRYYGPFQVEDRIGQVAYCLKLSASSRIHPVFHVSLLILHQGPPPTLPNHLPPQELDNYPIIEPYSVLDWKWDPSSSSPTKLVLVQWSSLSPEDTMWENWEQLQDSYDLGDKVVLPDGGNDSNSNTTISTSRPIRITKKPNHLKDYV